jgi:hypothetical protein
MVDMAVRQDDLLDLHLLRLRRRLQPVEIAAGIDEGALHRAVHHRSVQFCWSGVTGMTAAFMGGMDILPCGWLPRLLQPAAARQHSTTLTARPPSEVSL